MRNRARTLASREPLSTPPKPTQDLPTLINNKAAFALLAFGLIVFLLWFLLRRQQRPFRDEDIEQQQQQQQGLLCRSESGLSESTKASSEPAASKDEPVESVLELPNDGRRLACRQSGLRSGFPVFFLHGNLSSRLAAPAGTLAETDRVARACGVRLLQIDRPGIGGSSPHNGRSYESAAADLNAAADLLGVGAFAVLGWSSGGVHALAAAVLLPAARVVAVGGAAVDGPCTPLPSPWRLRNSDR
jgi:hypothetical protein